MANDSEKIPPPEEALFVDWDGTNDPQDPRNWSFRRRWTVTVVVSLFTFMRYAAPRYSSYARS